MLLMFCIIPPSRLPLEKPLRYSKIILNAIQRQSHQEYEIGKMYHKKLVYCLEIKKSSCIYGCISAIALMPCIYFLTFFSSTLGTENLNVITREKQGF
jgi:hypothetical protein